jgi:hypothetical protein
MIIGFSIAAPGGPIYVVGIRPTLVEGGLAGSICGLGAATADTIYGCIAGLGIAEAGRDYAFCERFDVGALR